MELNIAIKALVALIKGARLTVYQVLVQAEESKLSTDKLVKELNISYVILTGRYFVKLDRTFP